MDQLQTAASMLLTSDVDAPFVVLLMVTWNSMGYLPEAIGSVLAQTYRKFGVVVIDNGSTDGSWQYLQSIAAVDGRFRIVREKTNLGLARALNRGLPLCEGRWIARFDPDDRALPDRLERQLEFVAAHPEIKATSSFAYYIDGDGRRIGATYSDLLTERDFDRYRAANEPFMLLHPGALIDRQTLVELGGYRDEFTPAEDIDLWERISDRGLVLVQPEHLMEYRIHAGSTISHRHTAARLKQEWAVACARARRHRQPEPGWEAFLRDWESAPAWERLHRRRRILSALLSRRGREHLAARRRFDGMARLALAGMLRPAYTAPRIRGHLPAVFNRFGLGSTARVAR